MTIENTLHALQSLRPRNDCPASLPHHAVPTFDRTTSLANSVWDGTGRRKRDAYEEIDFSPQTSARSGDANVQDDIRFTRLQAELILEHTGLEIAAEFVDDMPAQEQGGNGRNADPTPMAADQLANEWNQHQDENGFYQLPYQFEDYPDANKIKVREHVQDFERATCLKLVEVEESDADYGDWEHVIVVHQGEDGPNESPGCWSYVGRIGWSKQYLSLSNWCTGSSTVQHEFVHALGFWHEQQRADLDKHIELNTDRWTCGGDGGIGGNVNYKCLNCDMPEVFNNWRPWQDLWSPYDYNSIMHYHGGVCSNWQDGGLMTYKGSDTTINPQAPGNRITTQDALQINRKYGCPLQETLPCTTWRHLAESVYLTSRRCDGVNDCSDGSDEENCVETPSELCTGDSITLLNRQFEKIGAKVNANDVYKSADNVYTLCFALGDLIGGGHWIVKEYQANDVDSCDPDACGAVFYGEHDNLSRCVIGTRFKKWENEAWAATSDAMHLAQVFVPIAPTDNKCEGTETYNEDLSGNGFMAAFGDGYKINKVMVGRGNSTVPYTAYGDDIFHNEGDQIRLECELGFTHDLGKRVMQAECKCDENGACAWEKKTPEWDCISNDNEQAIPIWGGAVNNFVRRVESKYIVLKARVTNGHKLSDWSHDRVDLVAHPDYSSNDWWGTQPFTMFIWCPFDTRKGGLNPDEGTMTFGDFYPGECSPDGKMCSFLSREGVHAYRSPDANVNAGLAGTAFFKGYIDRSDTVAEQGPITLVANTPDQWSCETGLLPGHNPVAINNMMNYFEMFKDGDFSTMLSYLRPHKDLPDVEEL